LNRPFKKESRRHGVSVLNSGLLPTDPAEFEALMRSLMFSETILPKDLEAGVTHWWKLQWRVREILYIGTPDSFGLWNQNNMH
jgi:hypothetical protein